MCGIAGFFNPEKKYTEHEEFYLNHLHNMIKSISHRGPDEHGTYLSNHCGLAHARLSIIDLYTGRQPISCTIAGKRYHIIYNGELYNMHELKNDLTRRGCHFDTTSDTEVILKMYIYYGIDFLKDLNGIFAFCIYDEAKDMLYLVRDHFGVKPLYYTEKDGTVYFASEIDTLFTDNLIKPEINTTSLNEIFTLGPSKTYGQGVFKNIYEVRPGEVLSISHKITDKRYYYRLTSRIHEDSYEETIEKTRYLIIDSIKRQMISDVPVATFLSGGIDSSIVSSVAASVYRENGTQLDTYSFDFTDNNIYFTANAFQPAADRPFVDVMIHYLKSNHTYLWCDYKQLADLLYPSVDSRSLPTMADVDSSLLYFCSEVKKQHKVVLTGECADEIFGGYPWFYRKELLNSEYFPWIQNFEFKKSLLNKDFADSLQMEDYLKNRYYESISEINILPGENEDETKRRRIAYLNIRWFMQTLLDRMDRTSMRNGLEARVPFADHRIVDYVFNVPWDFKYKNNTEKHLLREAAKGLVPDEILNRKKSPYPKTYHPEYEHILSNELKSVVNDSSQPIVKYLNKENVIRFLEAPKDYGKPWYGQLMAGPQMTAYLLQINYWLKKYNL